MARRPSSGARSHDRGIMRPDLQGIVERREVDQLIAPAKRHLDEMIGEPRILRQERAVEVRPIHGATDGPFGMVLPIVPESHDDLPERGRPGTEPRPPAVILEADERRAPEMRAADYDIADEPSRRRPGVFGGEIEESHSHEVLAVAGTVVVPQQLIAAAHRQDDGSGCGGLAQGGTFHGAEVLDGEALLAVFATPDEVQIVLAWDHGIAEAALLDAHYDAPPLRAMRKRHEVPAVAVEIEQIGIQV